MKSKILWLVIALVVIALGVGAYFAFTTGLINPSADTTPATMSFSPSSGTYNVGDTFDVQIVLNTGGAAVAGAQAYFTYNPAQLEIVDADSAVDGKQITPGTIFNTYMDNKEKSSTEFLISAVPLGGADYNGTGVLGTVKFKALAATTASQVTFNFTAGDTTKTGVTIGGLNVLASVTNASFVINASSGATFSANPTTITSGGSSVLSWKIPAVANTSNGQDSCTASPTTPVWYNNEPTGTATVKPTQDTTYKLSCKYAGVVEVIVKVSVKVSTAVTTCAAPTSETRTQTCPTGQTGSITQTRTKGAAPTCTWGSWKDTTNTCTVASSSTSTPTVSNSTASVATSQPAATGPETPLIAGGLLSLAFTAFYLVKRRIG